MSRYELRVLLSSWGLVVDLGLRASVAPVEPGFSIPVAPRVWLIVQPSARAGELEMPYLLSGLRRIAPRMSVELCVGEKHLVFVLDHLWFPPTDYQDDALELAVVGWAADELGIDVEPAEVLFDRSDNRYKIRYNEEVWNAEE